MWGSLEATVAVGPGFVHRTGFSRLLIPHPPVVNWLLRRNLPRSIREELVFDHEFAHFKFLPALLLYVLALVLFTYIESRLNLMAVLFILISGQAFWEMLSEGFVIGRNPKRYRLYYRDMIKYPRVVFWSVSTLFWSAGLLILCY